MAKLRMVMRFYKGCIHPGATKVPMQKLCLWDVPEILSIAHAGCCENHDPSLGSTHMSRAQKSADSFDAHTHMAANQQPLGL